MINSEFPVTLVPIELRKKIKYKKYKKNDFIVSSGEKKIVYLTSGKAHILRYEEHDENIYPYIFGKDEFIGVNVFLCQAFSNWEIIVNTDIAEGFEIPEDIFKTYILPSPIFLESYLSKCTQVLSHGAKAFYIYSKGGAASYFAFILDYAFLNYPIFTLDRYSDLTKILSVSKASLYNLTNKFIEEGIIKKERNSVYLLDRDKLKEYFEHLLT